eukprot:XP_025011897.1 uncharacterized protein LOC8287096 [Ricinus communis]
MTSYACNFHSSSARAGSSISSTVIPPYQGSNARVQALQAYYQQQPGNSPAICTPIISGTRRSSNCGALSQVGPVASSSDQTGFYFVPPGTSGRNIQEADNPPPIRFRAWERHHLQSFSSQVKLTENQVGYFIRLLVRQILTLDPAASGKGMELRECHLRIGLNFLDYPFG